MKFRLGVLIFWYLVYIFYDGPLKWMIISGEMQDLLDWTEGLQQFTIEVSTQISMFLYALISYAGFYYFYPSRSWAKCILVIIAAFLIPVGVRYIWEQIIYETVFGFTNYYGDPTMDYYTRDNMYFAFKYVFFGVVFYLIRYAIYNEGQKEALTLQNKQVELSMLRSQINPHFLLNAMNNIYSLVYQKSEKSLDAIDTLSGILKYTLYEKDELVSIEEELTHVDKIIDINRLRFAYNIPVAKNIDNNIEHVMIPPFIILPLIENAFKHGDFKDPKSPLEINVQTGNGQVNIRVKNKKGDFYKDKVGGIGLENIRKRLQLIYPDNHTFEASSNGNFFDVHIVIPKQ